MQNAYAKFNTSVKVWTKIELNANKWLSGSSVVNLEDIIDYCQDITFHQQEFHFLMLFEGILLLPHFFVINSINDSTHYDTLDA